MFTFTTLIPPDYVPLYLFVFVVFGALSLEVLSMRSDFHGARAWLLRAFPDKPAAWLERWNTVITIIIGPIIAAFLIQPDTEAQAIAAGLGWVGLVNAAAHASVERDG